VTKQELIAALQNILNNFIFGMVLTRLVPDSQWRHVANQKATFQGPDGSLLHVELAPFVVNFSNPTDRKILVEEFENGLKRALVSEGPEVILAYCEETNQFTLYKTEPWFQFARLIRNVVFYKDGGILRSWPSDLQRAGVDQVHWRSRMLDSRKVGKAVEFTHHEALQLFKDQMEFARKRLT
jgi:hypothetical protein